MKSNTRTVLAATLTNATSYSSGPLDVGDLYELSFMVDVSAVSDPTNTYLNIGVIDAFGTVHNVTSIQCNVTGPLSIHSLGAGLADAYTGANISFGDQIQVDLQIPASNTLSATISIKGK